MSSINAQRPVIDESNYKFRDSSTSFNSNELKISDEKTTTMVTPSTVVFTGDTTQTLNADMVNRLKQITNVAVEDNLVVYNKAGNTFEGKPIPVYLEKDKLEWPDGPSIDATAAQHLLDTVEKLDTMVENEKISDSLAIIKTDDGFGYVKLPKYLNYDDITINSKRVSTKTVVRNDGVGVSRDGATSIYSYDLISMYDTSGNLGKIDCHSAMESWKFSRRVSHRGTRPPDDYGVLIMEPSGVFGLIDPIKKITVGDETKKLPKGAKVPLSTILCECGNIVIEVKNSITEPTEYAFCVMSKRRPIFTSSLHGIEFSGNTKIDLCLPIEKDHEEESDDKLWLCRYKIVPDGSWSGVVLFTFVGNY